MKISLEWRTHNEKNILNLALVGALSASFLVAKPAHNANNATHNTKKRLILQQAC